MVSPLHSVISPVLVGRARQLDSLALLLEQPASEHGHVVLIAGEAGVGKSRFVAHACDQAGAKGFRILRGNCYEQDSALPYAPLTDLVRSALDAGTDETRSNVADSPAEIAQLVPEIAGRIPNPIRQPSPDPEQEKRRIFQAIDDFLVKQCGPSGSPLLITIEDLHWSDNTTLEFLLYFARRITLSPILLLLTYRNDETNPALDHFLATLDREHRAIELTLPRLDRDQVDAMLRAVFGMTRPTTLDFLDSLYRLTDGNPFFVEEIVKSLVAAGEIFYLDGVWQRKPMHELHIPRSVQDAVQRRSRQLPEATRQVMTLAGVAGIRFDFALLQELTGMDESELVGHIKRLMEAQLVVEASADQFAFRHALTREAAYDALLLRERKVLHQRIGEALEKLYRDALDAHISDLAFHFYLAEQWEKTLEYAQRAGERARTLFAPREAREQFTRALEAAQQLDRPKASLEKRKGELYWARGQANETLGDFDEARADLEAVLQIARAGQDSDREWGALIALGKLWASRDYTRTGEYYSSALAHARLLNDPSKIASSLNRVGNWYSNLDHPQDAGTAHREALEIFRTLENQEGIAETSDLLGMASYIGGDLASSADYFMQAIALFRELNDQPGLVSSLTTLALKSATAKTKTLVLPNKKLSQANADGEQALTVSLKIEWRPGEAYALWGLGAIMEGQGDFASALNHATRALALAEEIGHQQWVTAAHRILGEIYLDLLTPAQALEHLTNALALAQAIGSVHWTRVTGAALARAFILQSDLPRAQAVLDATLDKEAPMNSVGKRLCWLARAELALAQGDVESSQEMVERLLDTALNSEHGTRVIPALWKAHGEALLARHSSRAESVLLAALEAAHEQGALPLIWPIHIALGKAIQQQGRDDDAEIEFGASRETIRELGAKVPDTELREQFIARAHSLIPKGRTLSPRASAKKEYGGLTERERQIAVLIARGKSNREMAEALVVSERTVETHVGNILSKLGFEARTQIAAWAVEKRLTGESNRKDG